MTYKHISKEDRRRIEALTQAGSTNKEIAVIIGKSISTIGLELKRNSGHGARCYDCERAQKLTEKQRKDSKEPKISEKIWKKVFELFNLDLSPEQIASVVKISHESIYRRIYAEIRAGRLDRNHLRWGAKSDGSVYPNDHLGIPRNFRSKIVQISLLERNLAIGKAIPLSLFESKLPCYVG